MKLMVRSRSTVMRLVVDTPGRRVSFISCAPYRAILSRAAAKRKRLASILSAWLAHHFDQVQARFVVARPEPVARDPRQLHDGRGALHHGKLGRRVEIPQPQRPVRRSPVKVAQPLALARI